MKIINHLLYQDDNTPYPMRLSPNRGEMVQHEYLIMHYTAGRNAQAAVNILTDPDMKVSAHLVIAQDGNITQLVPFDTVAWHAGQSAWRGLTGLNRYSLGIELDNVGYMTRSPQGWKAWFGDRYTDEQVIEKKHRNQNIVRGWQIYPPRQLATALEVATLLVQYYQLKDIIGHDDVAPDRKSDPGPAFPMEDFRSRLFGRIIPL